MVHVAFKEIKMEKKTITVEHIRGNFSNKHKSVKEWDLADVESDDHFLTTVYLHLINLSIMLNAMALKQSNTTSMITFLLTS